MPDPYTTFQTAAAAVDLAQFVTKLVSKFIELKRSTDGRSVQHDDIRHTTNIMRQYCQSIDEGAKRAVPLRNPPPGGEDLKILTRRCSGVIDKLETIVEEVYSGRGHGIYKSIHTAFRSVWAENEIDELLKNLEMCRDQLSLGLMIRIREDMTSEFEHLRNSNKASQHEIGALIEKASSDLKTQIENLRRALCANTSWSEHRPEDGCVLEQVSSDSDDVKNPINHVLRIWSGMMSTSNEAIRQKIYNELSFRVTFQRYHSIPRVRFRTCDWVYENQPESTTKWPSLGSWLRSKSDCRLYCIFGKPGSGKSTLTGHICRDPKTMQCLESWAEHSKCIVAKHFFWNSGEKLQNSEQGLLRTWLFQLLTDLPEHTNTFFPKRYQHLKLGLQSGSAWSDEELREALFSFIEHYEQRCKILFVVDGLDEQVATEEQRQSTCDLLKALAENPSVKVCAASRPWNVYRKAFRGVPSLKLEDLNKADIEKYVEGRFSNADHHRKLLPADRIADQRLRNSIVSKAQGVFLWVRLVTDSILAGASNGDSIHDLFEKLREMPADLQEYLCKIIDGIPIKYRKDASNILLSSHRLREVMDYHFVRPCSVAEIFSSRCRTYTSAEIEILQEAEIDHIQACCSGLLELVSENYQPSYDYDPFKVSGTGSHQSNDNDYLLQHCETRVVLRSITPLHRTVVDLLKSDRVRKQLIGWYQGSIEPEMLPLCSFLAELKSCDLSQPWLSFSLYQSRWNSSVGFLDQDSRKAHCITEPFVREFSLLYEKQKEFSRSDPAHEINGLSSRHSFGTWRKRDAHQEMDFIAYSIEMGAHPDVLQNVLRLESAHLKQERIRPYLDHAARPHGTGFFIKPFVKTVQFLLNLGADPNERLGQSTVWGYFLESLPRWPDHFCCTAIKSKRSAIMKAYFESTKLFIMHGAVKPSCLRAVSGSQSDSGVKQKIGHIDPQKAITQAFSDEQQAELLALLAKHAYSRFGTRTRRQPRLLPKILPQHVIDCVDDRFAYSVFISQDGQTHMHIISPAGTLIEDLFLDADHSSTCSERRTVTKQQWTSQVPPQVRSFDYYDFP